MKLQTVFFIFFLVGVVAISANAEVADKKKLD
jgi:hypothetical protein